MIKPTTNDLPQRELSIARIVHARQVRQFGPEAGHPYVAHPIRVALALVKDCAEFGAIKAALLHDVLEDGPDIHRGDLLVLGVEEEVVRSVEILTQDDGEPYCEYIERVRQSGDAWAIQVKLADLADNLSTLPDGHSLTKRYLKAYARLTLPQGA